MKTISKNGVLFLVAISLSIVAITDLALAQKKPPPPRPGGKGTEIHERKIDTQGSHQIRGEVWVDNWFRLHVNGRPLLEDSVSLKTERSFNAERFDFRTDLPMTLAFEFRDFMENETGLEYIGSRNQQMGDGGAIAQFTDVSTGTLIASSGPDWRCIVHQAAPADRSCTRERNPSVSLANCAQSVTAIPADWTQPGFDDSSWPTATVHSERDVRPKDGYDRIDWDRTARLIWGPDLEKDNILFCRVTIE